MALVEVENLSVELLVGGKLRPVLRDVSFAIEAGDAMALVGESGAGKSMTSRAIARLLPGARSTGSVRVAGEDVLSLSGAKLRTARRRSVVIFQDPRAHVNPVRRIGDFVTEQLRTVDGVGRDEATRRSIAALESVGIPDAERRLGQFPHELSGGLLQRVMIATALLAEPEVILADKPTTALDVTTQSEVMAILDELRRRLKIALLFITHDLDLAAAVCDTTAVIYAGQIVEQQRSSSLHDQPLHPYSAALTGARPPIEGEIAPLAAIPGRAIASWQAGAGCSFAPRCAFARDACTAAVPDLTRPPDHAVRCIRSEQIRSELLAVARD